MMLAIGTSNGFAQVQEIPSVAKPSPTPPSVEKVGVTKQYIADAEKAFALVVAQRETLEKFLKERKATEVERKAAEMLIAAIDQLIRIKDLSIKTLENIVDLQAKAIKTLSDVIVKIESLNKKEKSDFQKFLSGAGKVLKAAGLILIGKGLVSENYKGRANKWVNGSLQISSIS